MFQWFRRTSTRPGTALAMIGARSSDHVLFLGARDPSIAAESGAVTRLNGRTVVVDSGNDASARTAEAAARAGAILEFVDAPLTALPFVAATFQIVVIQNVALDSDAATVLLEAARVLQPGGRIISMFGETARGMFGSLKPPPPPETDTVVNLFIRAGLVAGRLLATSEGVTYFEARKPRE